MLTNFSFIYGFTSIYETVPLLLRLSLGTFFVISGYHKLFHPQRRASLKQTFIDVGCYNPTLMWIIPLGELLGGLGVFFGAITPIAALGLIIICVGACLLDGLKRIKAWQPLDQCDFLDDILYLPEVLYVIMLICLIILGPGKYSVDAFIYLNLL